MDKEDVEFCKKEAKEYIEFMETAGDNAGWVRVLIWYIEQLENKVRQLGKGQQNLMNSRKKWKHRYYKEKNKAKDLQKSVDQIYDDYQDIGKMYFDLTEKIENKIKELKKDETYSMLNTIIIAVLQELLEKEK